MWCSNASHSLYKWPCVLSRLSSIPIAREENTVLALMWDAYQTQLEEHQGREVSAEFVWSYLLILESKAQIGERFSRVRPAKAPDLHSRAVLGRVPRGRWPQASQEGTVVCCFACLCVWFLCVCDRRVGISLYLNDTIHFYSFVSV